MAGKIIADTIETGAGADIPTSYVVNGSAKAWANLTGTGTIALNDSLNIGSTTDNGTGRYDFSFTTSFANANYGINYSVKRNSTGSGGVHSEARTLATGNTEIRGFGNGSASNTLNDQELVVIGIDGDLA